MFPGLWRFHLFHRVSVVGVASCRASVIPTSNSRSSFITDAISRRDRYLAAGVFRFLRLIPRREPPRLVPARGLAKFLPSSLRHVNHQITLPDSVGPIGAPPRH